MTFRLAFLCALAIAAIGGVGYSFINHGTAQDEAISADDREKIEAIIQDYLLENPQIVIDALDRYQALEDLRREAEAQASIEENLLNVISGEHGYAAGATLDDANVAVIEMFDYHCSFCKKATGYVYDLLEQQDDVRVVFRELPILREESDYAAKAALAAREQDKYQAFHFALMEASGVLTEDRIEAIAKDTGLDYEALMNTIEANDYDETFTETFQLARDLGITGTPVFIVASMDGSYSRIIEGWKPEELTESIDEARKSNS